MVPRIKEEPDPYMERSSSGIFGKIQISVGNSPGPKNSMFVDTLPSPYYDMLIVNTFMEFGDLMYSMGRIEDGIKRGRIVDTGASKKERKRSVPNEHV